MEKPKEFIFHNLRETGGPSEGCKLYTVTTIRTGKTQVVIEKTISERYPIQELEKITDLFERLTCGSGRKMFTLEELAHPYNPNPK